MGRKKMAGAGNRKCLVKWQLVIDHVSPRSFQYRERRMAFIEVAHLGFYSKRSQEPPPSNPQHHFLLQTKFRATAVEFSGNATESGNVRRIVRIEEKQVRPAHLY